MPTAPLAAARPRALLVLVLLLGAFLALRPPVVHASVVQASIMMDDDNLVYRNDRTRDATLTQMKSLGVDYVRVTLLWSNLANGVQAYDHKHHLRFNPANPAVYPPLNWNRYDGIVETASRLGMGVYFDLTGPGPSYSHARAPRSLRADVANAYEPNAQQFYYFVAAVGKRYSGTYRAHGITLPRVRVWSLWNEPNQGGWITPQWKNVGGQLVAWSPVIYRRLFFDGRLALQTTGHGKDTILIGETSPTQRPGARNATSAMSPTTFIEELFCVNSSLAPYAGAAASVRDCGAFSKNPVFYATAWAHHPYTKYTAPTTPPANAGDITMANISDLSNLLDRLASVTHRIYPSLPVLSTEFGYETKPPDPFFGIPLATQAQWNNEGDYLAFINPRIAAQTQFLLKDALPLAGARRGTKQYWSTYQSGIEYANGVAKPSYAAYLLPVAVFPPQPPQTLVDPTTGLPQITIWGQLRFLNNTGLGSGLNYVQVEFHPAGTPANAWVPVGEHVPVVDTFKHFVEDTVDVPGPGQVRLHYSNGGITPDRFSRAVTITATGVTGLS
jgi:hypothetical protein